MNEKSERESHNEEDEIVLSRVRSALRVVRAFVRSDFGRAEPEPAADLVKLSPSLCLSLVSI